jgi:hypothetical protein
VASPKLVARWDDDVTRLLASYGLFLGAGAILLPLLAVATLFVPPTAITPASTPR